MNDTTGGRMDRKGFTLIELMIVVVIIGILAAIAMPKYSQVSRAAKEAEAGPVLKQLFTLQERYHQGRDRYATDIDDLEGGSVSFAEGRYYQYQLTADPDGSAYLACAEPKLSGLAHFTIDRDRQISTTASCS